MFHVDDMSKPLTPRGTRASSHTAAVYPPSDATVLPNIGSGKSLPSWPSAAPPLPPRLPGAPTGSSHFVESSVVASVVPLSVSSDRHPSMWSQHSVAWHSQSTNDARRRITIVLLVVTAVVLLLIAILVPLAVTGKLAHSGGNNTAPASVNQTSSSSSSSSSASASAPPSASSSTAFVTSVSSLSAVSSSSFVHSVSSVSSVAAVTSSSSSISQPGSSSTPSISSSSGVPPSIVMANELFLQNRSESFYRMIGGMTATQVMTLLAPYTTALTGSSGLNDASFGGISASSAQNIQRLGAAQVLQLALYQGQTQYLSAAIAMVQLDISIRIMQFRIWAVSNASLTDGGPNGDVKQRQERGDIAWEAWLLHQAGAYFTAAPGHAAVNSTQQLVEQFTTDYVENLCNVTDWPTTGYNKEVAQGMHPAAILGIYGSISFQQLWPNSYTGFFVLWNGMMLGAQGSYEPDNSIGYTAFNLGMVLSMAQYMNRVNRTAANASDPNAYISDSVDMPRQLDGLAALMMSNGNAVNYNRGLIHWTKQGSTYYAYNGWATNAPFNLYMGYIIYGNPYYLYVGRKIERYMLTTGLLPASLLTPTEVYPTGIKQYNVLGVPPPAIVSELTYSRVSPNCYLGLLLCRAAPQSDTFLIPNKMVLRAGTVPGSDNNPYILLSLTGSGEHANTDQRMTLENTLYNGSYITARAGTTVGDPYGVSQVSNCNCILVAPRNFTNSSLSYPLIGDVTAPFYADMQLNSAANNYVLQSASVAQLDGGNAYGSMLFAQYEYAGVRTSRQVVLTAAGVIVVVDAVYNQAVGGSIAYNGGLTYRLWPNISASGTNWALQSPFSAISNTALLPSTNTSTLFWISSAPGRVIGLASEKLTDFGFGYAGQTASTLYAYDDVSSAAGGANTPHVFVSVMYPLANPTPSHAAAIASQISVTTSSTDGSTLVSIPGQPVVSVPYLSVAPAPVALVVWLSAQSLSSTVEGQPVASWPDSSGYGNTFTPLNSTAPLATVSATVMNGYPAVLFSGSQALVGPSVFPVYTDYTVSMLVQFPQLASGGQSMLGSVNGAQHVLACISGRFAVTHNTVLLTTTSAPQIKANQPQLVTYTWQQALGVASLYVNGTLAVNATTQTSTSMSDPSVVLGWFNNPAQGYQYLRAYVSEVLVFNGALATANRTSVENSIRNKYGLATETVST